MGGRIAAELGVGGGGTVAINPTAIVESITPGDYNVDDAIDDVQGAWNSATSVGLAPKPKAGTASARTATGGKV